MKKFLFRLIFALSVTFIAFSIADFIITKTLRKNNKLDIVFKGNSNHDLIIFGSSKAYNHVNPRIIDSVLHVDSFNLGLDGTPFIHQDFIIKQYLKNNTHPKYIIQIVSNGLFVNRENLFRYTLFSPYMKDKDVYKFTNKYNGFDWVDYYLPLFRYSKGYEDIIKSSFSIFRKYNYKGCYLNTGQMDNSFEKFKKNNPNGITIEMNKSIMSLFENYIKRCKKENITTFLVYPPTYKSAQKYINNRDSIISFYKTLSKKYDIPFWDYSDSTISESKTNFSNSQHMNYIGANKFTKSLALKIKEYESSKKR